MNEGRRRRRTRRAPGPTQQEPKPSGPVLQDLIIEDRVLKFLENSVQDKLRKSAIHRLEALRDPENRRGSIKIKGRPKRDPMFRIETGSYRIFYKRISGKVHAIDMEHRGQIYNKGRARKR